MPSEASIRLFRLLWQLEVWLREMVYVELRSRDVDWQAQIRKEAQNGRPQSQAADRRLTHMATRHESELYLTLGELLEIIQDKPNWPLFAEYFPPKDIMASRMREILQIRNRIAQFRDPHESDTDRVILLLRDFDQGIWHFATPYSGLGVYLPDTMTDAVSDCFHETHDRRWLVEMLTIDGQWRYAADGRQPRLNFHIQGSRRPWSTSTGRSLAGQPGFIYHATFTALSGQRFLIDRVLEQTQSIHRHCVHIRLDAHSLEVRVPSTIDHASIISTIERFLECCIESVSVGPPFDHQRVEKIASEWPEYVLGPTNPLGFLDREMPCAMFTLD